MIQEEIIFPPPFIRPHPYKVFLGVGGWGCIKFGPVDDDHSINMRGWSASRVGHSTFFKCTTSSSRGSFVSYTSKRGDIREKRRAKLRLQGQTIAELCSVFPQDLSLSNRGVSTET